MAALGEDAQQLGLHPQRHVPGFVEEQRSPVRRLEEAGSRRGRPREGPALVAEQLTLEQGVRKGRAVHGDERLVCARAEAVDRASGQFLAHARLARDEDGGVGAGDPRDLVLDDRHHGTVGRHGLDGVVVPDDPLQALVGAHEVRTLQRASHGRQRVLGHEGFRQEVECARAHGLDREIDGGVCREHDHGHGGVHLARRLQDRERVTVPHAVVGQDQVERRAAQGLAGVGDSRCVDDVMAILPQQESQHATQADFVIDDEDAAHGGGQAGTVAASAGDV